MNSRKLRRIFLLVSVIVIGAMLLSACDTVSGLLGDTTTTDQGSVTGSSQAADTGDKPAGGTASGGTMPTPTIVAGTGDTAAASGDKPGGSTTTTTGGSSGAVAPTPPPAASSGGGSSGCVPGAYNMGSIAFGTTVNTVTISAAGDIYTFYGNSGDPITINTAGVNGYDTYLELYNSSCTLIASDDDSGTGFNAMLAGNLPSSGMYTIRVRGYSGATGNYSISLSSGVVTPGGGGAPSGTYNMGSISCGQTVSTVTITSGGDSYAFAGSAGQSVTIAMNGVNGYDTYLELWYGGSQIGYNDDGGPGLNSLLSATLPNSGTYTIIARGLGGALGNYSITVTCGGAAPGGGSAPSGTYNMGSISCGQTVSTVTVTSGGDSYSFAGSAGQSVSIAMNGVNGYDTYLELYYGGSQIGYNDDGGPGLNSLLSATLPYSGTYTIIARGLGGALGNYSITVTCGGGGGNPPPSGGSACAGSGGAGYNMGTLSYGQSVSSFTISAAGDAYRFTGSAGGTAVISMIGSGGYDTYLELYDPYCGLVTTNDDGAGYPNARISTTLPYSGTYTIIARGYAGRTGSYTITLSH